MKIALFALLGLLLGAVGGAALGIGAGLAWVEIFKTTDFEGYSGMLVFFTFMPAGAMIGGLGGAALFGILAAGDDEIAIESRNHRCIIRAGPRNRPHLCNAKLHLHFGQLPLLEPSNIGTAIQARRRR